LHYCDELALRTGVQHSDKALTKKMNAPATMANVGGKHILRLEGLDAWLRTELQTKLITNGKIK
jgi:hypothetical protein